MKPSILLKTNMQPSKVLFALSIYGITLMSDSVYTTVGTWSDTIAYLLAMFSTYVFVFTYGSRVITNILRRTSRGDNVTYRMRYALQRLLVNSTLYLTYTYVGMSRSGILLYVSVLTIVIVSFYIVVLIHYILYMYTTADEVDDCESAPAM